MSITPPTRVKANVDHFTGRTWLLPKLLEWLEHSDSRTFILVGEPGTGKSMIMAWLAGLGPLPEDPYSQAQLTRLRHAVKGAYFCQADSRNITPQAFAEGIADQLTSALPGFSDALAATLADRVQIVADQKIETVAPGGMATAVSLRHLSLSGLGDELSFDRGVIRPLKTLYRSGAGEPVLLLVDALDEALGYTGDKTLPALLATVADLPPQVRFLLTTRDDERVLDFYPGVKPFNLIRDLQPTAGDIETYVLRRLSGNVALGPSEQADFARRISFQASGIFLYAALLLDDLLPQLSRIQDLNAYPLPSGLSGLYHAFLVREIGTEDKGRRWHAIYKPLLGLIAVAHGEGFTAEELAAFIGQDVDEALDVCKQYLAGALPTGPFKLFHKSFTDFLLQDDNNRRYHIDALAMHHCICAHYEQRFRSDWLKCRSRYALEYLPAHLMSILRLNQGNEEADQLCRLMTDIAFLERKTADIGVFATIADLTASCRLLGTEHPQNAQSRYIQVLGIESHHLVDWNSNEEPGRFAQQVLQCATKLHFSELAGKAAEALQRRSIPYLAERWGSGHVYTGLVRTLVGHTGKVWTVAVNSARGIIASGGDDGTVRLWRVDTGRAETTFDLNRGRVRAVAFTSNDHLVAAAGDEGMISIWCLGGDKELTTSPAVILSGHGSEVLSLTGIPGTAMIASGDVKGYIRIWNLDDGSWVEVRAHQKEVRSLAVSTLTGGFVSASADCSVRLWRSDGTAARPKMKIEGATIRSICVSPDGRKIYCAASDGTVKVRTLVRDQGPCGNGEDGEYRGHRGRVRSVVVTEDGRYVMSGAEDSLIKVWDASGCKGSPVADISGHSGTVWALATVPGSTLLVSGADDGAIKIWDHSQIFHLNALSRECRSGISGHGVPVSAIAASADGSIAVSGAKNGTTKLWSASTAVPAGVNESVEVVDLPRHKKEVTALAIGSASHVVLSGSRDKALRVWNLDAQREQHLLKEHPKEISCMVLDPREKTAASASEDGSIFLWKIGGGPSLALMGHDKAVMALAMEPGSDRLISGAVDGSVGLWSAVYPATVEELSRQRLPIFLSRLHTKAVLAIAVTADGKYAVSAGADGLLKVMELPAQGQLDEGGHPLRVLGTLCGHEGPVFRVALTHDGSRAVSISAADCTIRVWDLATITASGHPGYTTSPLCMAPIKRPKSVAPLGRTGMFAVISAEDRIDVWKIASGNDPARQGLKRIASVSLDYWLTCLAVALEGSCMIVGGRTGDVSCFEMRGPKSQVTPESK